MTSEPSEPTGPGVPPRRADYQPALPGRRLLLGGIPLAVTLASRPALAMTGECSVSNVLSGNLSHPLPAGVNCGMTPQTWCNLSGTNQLWPRTGMYPQTTFVNACGELPIGGIWSCGSQSLLSAMQGSLLVQCTIKGNKVTLDANSFGQQISAAMLNAAAFSPNNYPMSTSQVRGLVIPIWNQTPTSQSAAQALLELGERQGRTAQHQYLMPPGCWRLADAVLWREWDGEIIAYNDLTGDTHHFADLAAWIFALLRDRAASPADIERAVAAEIDLPPGIDRAEAIARTLTLFQNLRLVEPEGPSLARH